MSLTSGESGSIARRGIAGTDLARFGTPRGVLQLPVFY